MYKLDYLWYFINSNIPVLKKRSGYITVYGPDFSNERKVYSLIKKQCKTDSIDFFAIGDGKLFHYLNSKLMNRVKGYDINTKNIEFSKKNFVNCDVTTINDYLSLDSYSETLICYNILNSIKPEERKKYFKLFCDKYRNIIFIGNVVLSDRAALGPEPIGSYGCKQFSTVFLFSELSEISTIKEINMGDNIYCYISIQ